MSYVIDALMAHAKQQPKKTAIVTKNKSLNYGQLVEEMLAVAQLFSSTGCHTVGVDLDNSVPWVLADLAAMEAGLTAVPIPGFFSEGQVAHLLETAQVDLLLRDHGDAPGDGWQELVSKHVGIRLYSRQVPKASSSAKVTFTSGSTGNPKGVVLSQQAIDDTTRGLVESLSPLGLARHLSVLPFATLLENIAGIYAPIVHGSELQITSLADVGLTGASLDIDKFVALLTEVEADSMILVPQLLTAIVTLTEFGLLDLSKYKMLAVGGGRVSKSLLDKASALNLSVFEGYGLSEGGSVLTLNLPGTNLPGSVGKPLPHAQIRTSVEGEIEIHGTVMEGYLNDAPVVADGWYPTGDLGHIDADGFVHVTGRKKNVFITAFGRNVNPEWIEAALSQQPAISQAVAYGEGRDHNIALIWLRFETEHAEVERLVSDVNLELPDYAQIHDFIVVSEALPDSMITANGRVKRDLVIERYIELINEHYTPNPRRLAHVVL